MLIHSSCWQPFVSPEDRAKKEPRGGADRVVWSDGPTVGRRAKESLGMRGGRKGRGRRDTRHEMSLFDQTCLESRVYVGPKPRKGKTKQKTPWKREPWLDN